MEARISFCLEKSIRLGRLARALPARGIDFSHMMPRVGIEPTTLAGHDFKSCAYTSSAIRAIFCKHRSPLVDQQFFALLFLNYLRRRPGSNRRIAVLQTAALTNFATTPACPRKIYTNNSANATRVRAAPRECVAPGYHADGTGIICQKYSRLILQVRLCAGDFFRRCLLQKKTSAQRACGCVL